MSNQQQMRAGPGVVVLFTILTAFLCAPLVLAQEGRLVREKVHGPSLEKTVTGESADRTVSIYLPPSYDSAPNKRYPVVYLLHGITDTDEAWITPRTNRAGRLATEVLPYFWLLLDSDGAR